MCKDTKDKSDKDCTDKINQLKKERKPIMNIDIKHSSFDIRSISKNIEIKKECFFVYYKDGYNNCLTYENAKVDTITVNNKELF